MGLRVNEHPPLLPPALGLLYQAERRGLVVAYYAALAAREVERRLVCERDRDLAPAQELVVRLLECRLCILNRGRACVEFTFDIHVSSDSCAPRITGVTPSSGSAAVR